MSGSEIERASQAHHHHVHAQAPLRPERHVSLLALSSGQRLVLVLPVIAMLWALAHWAMRA